MDDRSHGDEPRPATLLDYRGAADPEPPRSYRELAWFVAAMIVLALTLLLLLK